MTPAPLLRGLLPAHVATAQMSFAGDSFAAGRACAAAALAQLGIHEFALARARDGAPCWPDGINGSIAHAGGVALAAAARGGGLLGIDAEVTDAVDVSSWPLLLGPDEDTARAAAIFCAKEAFYKAQAPLTGEWLEFRDVVCDVRDGHFTLRPARPLRLEGRIAPPWRGTYRSDGALTAAAIFLQGPG